MERCRWAETTNRRRRSVSSSSARLRGVARHDMNLQRTRSRRTSSQVGRKMRELRMLVPGGRDLQAEQLFLRTADYISELRMQVQTLRALSKLYCPCP